MTIYNGKEPDLIEELQERCRCAAALAEGEEYKPDPSQRDFQSVLLDVWNRAWRHFKLENAPPRLPTVTTKIQALEALADLTKWPEGRRLPTNRLNQFPQCSTVSRRSPRGQGLDGAGTLRLLELAEQLRLELDVERIRRERAEFLLRTAYREEERRRESRTP
jgi:hypothetical protein